MRFPLGGLGRGPVRARAAALGLPNAAKPESQEICFVPDGDYAGFVSTQGAASRGRSLPVAGEIVDGGGACSAASTRACTGSRSASTAGSAT